jgi:PAS domain S-box-containing protein
VIKKAPPLIKRWLSGQLFEYAPIYITVLDEQLNIVVANHNFQAVFGEADGRKCYQVYKKREVSCKPCAAQRVFLDGRARRSDETGVDRLGQGVEYVVHHAPILDESGQVAYVAKMSYDVTEQKDLQKQLDLVFNLAPCSVAIINKNLRIMQANDHVRSRFGEVTGVHCYEVYRHRTDPCADCPAVATLADGQTHTVQQTRFGLDGEPQNYLVSTAPLSTGARDKDFVVEMSLNVTELHQLAEIAAVGRGVGEIAHRMKNVLTGLRGSAYDIRTGFQRDLPERTAGGLESLTRNVDRLNTLVTGCTKVTRGVSGQMAAVDPEEVGKEIVDLFRDVAAQDGVELIFEPAPGDHRLWMDAEGITACLANIVSNGIEACGSRRSDASDPCRVTLRIEVDPDWVHFVVSDTGCGMDPVTREKLFKAPVSTKGWQGNGMGLLVASRVVADHGGTLTVNSEPGQGATFSVALPRRDEPGINTTQSGRGHAKGDQRDQDPNY